MGNSYILGLVRPESYNEDKFTDAELSRAQDLVYEGTTPLTGFEIHLMKCHKGKAGPATPKEAALLKRLPDYGDYGEPEQLSPDSEKDYADVIKEWVIDCPASYRYMGRQDAIIQQDSEAATATEYLKNLRDDFDD